MKVQANQTFWNQDQQIVEIVSINLRAKKYAYVKSSLSSQSKDSHTAQGNQLPRIMCDINVEHLI